MQKYFIKMIIGGSNEYKGRNLVRAHEKLEINDMHFNVLKEHLLASFDKYKLSKTFYRDFESIIETLRMSIVSKKVSL